MAYKTRKNFQRPSMEAGAAAAARLLEGYLTKKMANLNVSNRTYNKQGQTKVYKPFGSTTSTRTKKKAPVPSRTTLRYNTTGKLGKLKAPRKYSGQDDFAKYGSEIQIENRGVVQSTETVFLGHSCVAYRRIHQAVCRTMLKQIMLKVGIDIVDWTLPLNPATAQDWWLTFRFYPSQTALTTTNLVLSFVSTTASAGVVAILLSDAIESGVSASPIIPKTLEFSRGPPGATPIEAVLHLQDLKLDFNLTSKLTFQNQTLAGVAAADPDDDTRDSISNNPLKIRTYQSNSNGFQEKTKLATITGPYLSFVAHPTTALIQGDFAQNPNHLRKLPSPDFFKGTTSFTSKNIIAPGEIKTSTISYVKSMMYQTFCTIFAYSINLNSDTLPLPIPIGKSQLFGMEKVLQGAGENPVSVSWELNQIIKVKSNYHHQVKSLPLMESN